jgi:Zn-finger nucleic acid-binding protein
VQLHERDREGITIDVCPQCRGLWLDRGELEKLIAREARDLDEPPRAPRRSSSGYEDRDSTPTGMYRDEHGRYHRRKRSWVESLGDIFD